MRLTAVHAQQLTGDADRWLEPLNDALIRWEISTPARVTMFLAQCAHESGGFKHLVENLHYSAAALLATWPKRFTADEAVAMAYNEEAIAERAYGGRMGNGPEGSGDGYRYRGRGGGLTGRDNYRRCGAALGIDLEAHPELLEQPRWAAQSFGWFWATNGCNALADAGDYEAITRRINGGLNGWDDRVHWLAKVRDILGTPATQPAAPIDDKSTEYAPPVGGTTNQEAPMGALALLQMFGPVLAGLIPQIASILKPESEVAKRNVGLAQTLVDTIVTASGTPNLQAAVEKMQTDPVVKAAVQKAVVTEPSVMVVLEIGGGIKEAREADAKATQADKSFLWSPVFWISMAMLPLIYWYVGSSVVGGIEIPKDWPWPAQLPLKMFGTAWSLDARSGLANLVVGLVLGGICGVYYGVSVTQRNVDKSTEGGGKQ